ncbi:hypothetical protein [Archaeoglobus sp.]
MSYPLLVRAVKKGGGYQWIEIRFEEVMSLPMSQKELNFRKRLNKMFRHDILNIFTRLYAYAELLEERYDRGLVEKIKESVRSGVNIIKKVREFESSAEEDRKSFQS